MTRCVLSAMRRRCINSTALNFAHRYPPSLHSPHLLTCTRHYNGGNSTSPTKIWEHAFFQCPNRDCPVQSAFWPFSLFAQRRQREQDLETRVADMQKELLDLGSKLGHRIHLIKRETTDVEQSLRRELAAGDLKRQEEARELMRQLANVGSEVLKLESNDLHHKEEIRKIAVQQKEATELEKGLDLRIANLKENDSTHFKAITKLNVQIGSLTRTVSNLQNGDFRQKEQIKSLRLVIDKIQQILSGDDSQATPSSVTSTSLVVPAPPLYSPDAHLKYVRRIEEMFGFQFENHSLVWQALQYKRGTHKDTEGFNKALALEGDAALKLTMVIKGVRSGKLEVISPAGQTILSNRHMLRLGNNMGLNQLIFPRNLKTNEDRPDRVGTTMEAIFAVVHRQGGTDALDKVLEFIRFEDVAYLEPTSDPPSTDTTDNLNKHSETHVESASKAIQLSERAGNAETAIPVQTDQSSSISKDSNDSVQDKTKAKRFSPFESLRKVWKSVTTPSSSEVVTETQSVPSKTEVVTETQSESSKTEAPLTKHTTYGVPPGIELEVWQEHLSGWKERAQAVIEALKASESEMREIHQRQGEMRVTAKLTKTRSSYQKTTNEWSTLQSRISKTRLNSDYLKREYRVINNYTQQLKDGQANPLNPYDFVELLINSFEETEIGRKYWEMEETNFSKELKSVLRNCRQSGDGAQIVLQLISARLETQRASGELLPKEYRDMKVLTRLLERSMSWTPTSLERDMFE